MEEEIINIDQNNLSNRSYMPMQHYNGLEMSNIAQYYSSENDRLLDGQYRSVLLLTEITEYRN